MIPLCFLPVLPAKSEVFIVTGRLEEDIEEQRMTEQSHY